MNALVLLGGETVPARTEHVCCEKVMALASPLALLGYVYGEVLVQPPGSYCHGHTWTWGCKIPDTGVQLPDLGCKNY